MLAGPGCYHLKSEHLQLVRGRTKSPQTVSSHICYLCGACVGLYSFSLPEGGRHLTVHARFITLVFVCSIDNETPLNEVVCIAGGTFRMVEQLDRCVRTRFRFQLGRSSQESNETVRFHV